MKVTFRRTGARRYAVIVESVGRAQQSVHPAPGYDDDIPHDLVHYVVEAELALSSGVFGRAASGGGSFIAAQEGSARDRARQQRKQRRREQALRVEDEGDRSDMATSERLAALSDVAFRRRHGQKADPLRAPPIAPTPADEPRVDRVVARLTSLAPRWRALPVGGELAFLWPSLEPLG